LYSESFARAFDQRNWAPFDVHTTSKSYFLDFEHNFHVLE
jgi:hypothetical protein